MYTSRPKSCLSNCEATTFLTKEVRLRHMDTIEPNLRVTASILITKHPGLSFNIDPRYVERNDHHRLPPMSICVGIGDSHYD